LVEDKSANSGNIIIDSEYSDISRQFKTPIMMFAYSYIITSFYIIFDATLHHYEVDDFNNRSIMLPQLIMK